MPESKYKIAQARHVAIFDAAYDAHGRKPISMDEVATWAMSHDLVPVPRRGCPIEEALAWEQKLEAAKAV